mgnify:CR=1 FL=1
MYTQTLRPNNNNFTCHIKKNRDKLGIIVSSELRVRVVYPQHIPGTTMPCKNGGSNAWTSTYPTPSMMDGLTAGYDGMMASTIHGCMKKKGSTPGAGAPISGPTAPHTADCCFKLVWQRLGSGTCKHMYEFGSGSSHILCHEFGTFPCEVKTSLEYIY